MWARSSFLHYSLKGTMSLCVEGNNILHSCKIDNCYDVVVVSFKLTLGFYVQNSVFLKFT